MIPTKTHPTLNRPNAPGFDSWDYLNLPNNMDTKCENCNQVAKSFFFRHFRKTSGTMLLTCVICSKCATERGQEALNKMDGRNFVG